MADLSAAVEKAFKAHGIGQGAPPAKAELWEEFRGRPEVEAETWKVENRFYAGYDHEMLDWSRPVHGIVVDFKGDSMQLGMILRRLTELSQQYIFVGNPLPFNGGWHFTAVNDFEHPDAQRQLESSWQNIRVWSQVNYVATVTEAGASSLTPRQAYSPEKKHDGAIPLATGFRLSSLIFTGGLMPHTLIATAISETSPLNALISKHLELGATLAVVGHGLDVLIACGVAERSLVSGCEAAVFPPQAHLAEITGLRRAACDVCSYTTPSGAVLLSAAFWGAGTVEAWFAGLGLTASGGAVAAPGAHVVATDEPVLRLDVEKLTGMAGAVCALDGRPPTTAVFVDEVADPIEIYTILAHLLEERLSFQIVGRSNGEAAPSAKVRKVTSETVFGNPMYGLRECTVVVPTTPADQVSRDSAFDSFFVAGGQCPYHLMGDSNVLRVMDNATIAAAVCHGPEALIGSKWLRPDAALKFTAYTGCWMSFRDVLDRFEKLKPGEVVGDEGATLFSGNAPNATKEMTRRACAAIKRLRAA